MARREWFWPLVLFFLLAALLLWPRPEPPKAMEADALTPVAEGTKLVALTFDDGPKARTTAKLLDGLDQRGVKATFFLIGAQIEDNRELVLRMAQSGHQVGIHTYDHVALSDLSESDMTAQVERTRQALQELLGDESFFLRPPYGLVSDTVLRHAQTPLILWSVDPEDWHKRNVQREVAHIVSHVQDGDIILMHDIFPESVEAALQVIDQLHHAGYAFVTVEELFAARGTALEPGQVYRYCPPPG